MNVGTVQPEGTDTPRSPGGLRITVAICTWNRSPSLRQTLDGFTGIAAPAATKWELLVVNNNCTDGTDEVIRAFEDRLPVRRAFEPRPGLSHARNRAIAEATGDYILWTDDDVTVCRDWLVAYADAFRRWPDAALFGGPIRALVRRNAAGMVAANLPLNRRSVCRPRFRIGADSALAARHSWGANYVRPCTRAVQPSV